MQLNPSPLQLTKYKEYDIYIKRDDLLHVDFSGNKARKFHYFLENSFPNIKRVISYGSNQSNAMYSLSVLSKLKGWEFMYFVSHIPGFLKDNPIGNYKAALHNGMKIYESSDKQGDAYIHEDEDSLVIEEGGRQAEAEFGVKILAEELIEDIKKAGIENPYVFLPSGTGTTALFLQKNLPYRVYTCSCVGDDEYLKEQWKMVEDDEDIFPTILNVNKKYHYGKLDMDLYNIWKDIKDETKIEFDLMYDPVGWVNFLAHCEEIDGTPIFIHQGGVLGNESMLARYQRKFDIIAKS